MIYKMQRWHHSIRRIAKELGRSASTVSRELRRNARAVDRNTDYIEQAHAAQDAAHERRVAASKKRMRLKNELICDYVEKSIKSHLSPELTAGRLKIDHPGYSISRESIYQYIIKERTELAGYLPNAGKKRRKRRSLRKRRVKPVATPKRSIEERFQEANERLSIGHLEVDSVIGRQGKSAIVNVVDRKSRKVWLIKVPNLQSETVSNAIIARFVSSVPLEVLYSMTSDNGSEFALWESVEQALKIKVFFCHPGCASERGTNENRNRAAVRTYFPKGTDFDDIPDEYIEFAEHLHNSKPMKVLGFHTPDEIWFNELKKYLAAFTLAA